MLKRSLDVLLFSGTIPLGVLFLYSLPMIFSSRTQEEYFRSISIAMLAVMLLGILIFLFFFSRPFSTKLESDRLKGLVKRKVYTAEGDYVGFVKDVLILDNKIYGLVVKLSESRKKVVVKTPQIKSFGEVILVNIPIEKLK